MKAASLGSRDAEGVDLRPRLSMNPSSEFSSGSEKPMSKPITFAPSRDSVSTSAAIFDRGQGQRPSASRLFSSITAIATAGEGGRGPREDSGRRRSSAPSGRGGERRARRARGRRGWRRASGTPAQPRRVTGARTSSTSAGRRPGRAEILPSFFVSARAATALLSSSSTIRTKTSRGWAPESGRRSRRRSACQ